MRHLLIIPLIFIFFLSGLSCKKDQESPISKQEEEIVKKVEELPQGKYVNRMKVDSKDANLKLVVGSKNVHSIELKNNIPIRGVQFVLKGVKITNIQTTVRTKGYLASFNGESGAVMLVDTSGGNIQPGTGSIAEIECANSGSPDLSAIKIAK